MAVPDKPGDFLRHHQAQLGNLVVAAGLQGIAVLCEQKDIVGTDMKEKIVNESSGKTETERGILLIDTVRKLLVDVDEADDIKTLDEFFCIIYRKSGSKGRANLEAIAKKYDRPLPLFAEFTDRSPDKPSINATDSLCSLEASLPVLSNIYPGQSLDVASLSDALKSLLHWDKFARKLPTIVESDIQRIKLENKEDIEGQKSALFDKWLRKDVSASWKTVTEALDLVDEQKLANELRRTLNVRRQSSTFSSDSVASFMSQTSRSPLQSFPLQAPLTLPSQQPQPLLIEKPDNHEKPIDEQPDNTLDSKKLFDKRPLLEDVLKAVPANCNCENFRRSLRVHTDRGELKDVIEEWMEAEPNDVTWRTILTALKDSSRRGTARKIIENYLKLPSVYKRYIYREDFTKMDDVLNL